MSGDLSLDMLGILEGTDKSSTCASGWDYLRHYERWFAEWKDEPISFIEIGVAAGSSLRVWSEYFPKARIIGVDANPDCARYATDRAIIEIGSQDDPEFLRHLCSKYRPTIVIDDGSHFAHHIVYTFEQMFPSLAPGGLYVVEDLEVHFSSSDEYSPVKGYAPIGYFLDLAKACMTRQNRAELWGTRKSIVDHTDAVTFVQSAACIRKTAPQAATTDAENVRRYVKNRSLSGEAILRFAHYSERQWPGHERNHRSVPENGHDRIGR